MRSLFIAVFVFVAPLAFARGESTLQTRIQLQQHLSQSLQDYDPQGRVVVYLDESGGSVLPPLPGIAQTQNFKGRTVVSAQKRFTAHVFTSLEELPKDLEDEFQSYLSHSGTKARIELFPSSERPRARTPASVDGPQNSESNEIVVNASSDSSEQQGPSSIWIMALIAIGSGIAFLLWWGMRGIQQQLASKQATTPTSAPVAQPRSSRKEAPASDLAWTPNYRASSGASSSELKLPDESVVAILSDCYWCEEDAYAHWLWQSLSSEQQTRLLSQWSACKAYSEYFSSVNPLEKSFHKEVFYLDAPDWKHLSNVEAVSLLKQNAVYWKGLSPMRKQKLDLGLAERSQVIEKASKVEFSKEEFASLTQYNSSKARSFAERMYVESVSAKFEEEILSSKSDQQRKWAQELPPTLVWLSLVQLSKRKEALREFSAEEIAEAWVGSEKVLDQIKLALPESKWELVQDYLSQVSPSQSSESYHSLAEVGVQLFKQKNIPHVAESSKQKVA